MTRINASIEPANLCTKHLLAEYHELPRVLTLSERYVSNDLPKEFTLGKGHVKFFYNKLMFLHIRFTRLAKELKARGINIDMVKYREVIQRFRTCRSNWYNNWIPDKQTHMLLRARIICRLEDMGADEKWISKLIPSEIYFECYPDLSV